MKVLLLQIAQHYISMNVQVVQSYIQCKVHWFDNTDYRIQVTVIHAIANDIIKLKCIYIVFYGTAMIYYIHDTYLYAKYIIKEIAVQVERRYFISLQKNKGYFFFFGSINYLSTYLGRQVLFQIKEIQQPPGSSDSMLNQHLG